MNFDDLLAADLPTPLVWCVLAWLFAVGACIGSFMNVVIYRLPAGLSLLHPASRCPACETPIRVTDNVPVVGWLWLRGRCRQCRAAISARYPAVELLVALLFVALAWCEPLSFGGNLPSAERQGSMGQLWGIYAYHLFLLCSLICAAFTEYDGHRLSWRLIVPGLLVGVIAPLAWPFLRPLAGESTMPAWLIALIEGLIGAAAGVLLGYAIGLVKQIVTQTKSGPSQAPGWCSAVALAWIGIFLGWQAAVALAVAVAVTQAVAAAIGRFIPIVRRIGPIGYLVAWAMIWIVWLPKIARHL